MKRQETTHHAFERGGNPLTPAQAGELAGHIEHTASNINPDDLSRLLLLCYAFTYERDSDTREAMLMAVEQKIGMSLPAFDDMMRGEMSRMLGTLKKGCRGGR